MLSYNLNDSEKTNYDFIVKALDVQTASGYIVNRNYYDKLIGHILYILSAQLESIGSMQMTKYGKGINAMTNFTVLHLE